MKTPSNAVQRAVAGRFADAVLRGDAAGARALLVQTHDGALATMVDRTAAPWRVQHASIRPPARHTGTQWTFRYRGRRALRDGRFETQSGDLIVVVAGSGSGAGVQFFSATHVMRLFSTHHDSQLSPSKR